ncbi:MAG: preprotein translocase subunit YajC [Limisphaerales bacterium]
MTLLAIAGLLAADTVPTGGPEINPKAQMMQTVGMMVIMLVAFYFILIRPQNQQRKKQEEMLKALKKGDKVVTTSGILATVVSVKDRTVTIRSEDAKLEVLKSAITQVVEDFDKADPTPAPAAAKA